MIETKTSKCSLSSKFSFVIDIEDHPLLEASWSSILHIGITNICLNILFILVYNI